MNTVVKEHVRQYNIRERQDDSDAGVIETILEAKIIWRDVVGKRRWWNDVFCVVEVNGMLIGYDGAATTGDNNPRDVGWEFDPSTICAVKPKEITTIIFEKVNL